MSPQAIIKKTSKAYKILTNEGPIVFIKKVKNKIIGHNFNKLVNHQYQQWFIKNYPSKEIIELQKQQQARLKYRPKISIITPVYNTPEKYLRRCIESVIDQTYDNWELCIVDDASMEEIVRKIILEYERKDNRIKFLFRKKNGHICEASNDSIKIASGKYLGFLDHDDFLWPNALFEVVKLVNEKPHTEFIYTDEDKISESGAIHSDPFFKPGWNPEYLLSINYITHFTVIKKDLVNKIGGFRKGFEGAQDWDLYLRATRVLEKEGSCNLLNNENPIQHIPSILYSWRKSSKSTAENAADAKNYAYVAQKKVLENNLKERKIIGDVSPSKYLGLWNKNYEIKNDPLVSIIIPTKDQFEYISRCIDSILTKTSYKNYEIIIVDTGSDDPKVWDLYKKYESDKIRIIKWKKHFNFAAVCNYGAKESKGEYLLFLNNDTRLISANWLEGMLGVAQNKEIGAVGCKLLYPDGKIQHGGIILMMDKGNILKGTAFHAFKLLKNDCDYQIYNSMIYGVKNYSAVTAACLMIEKKKYIEVKGMDEKLEIAFNDVDFCLKLMTKGYRNIYLGNINLYHYESVSVGLPGSVNRNQELFNKETEYFQKKWRNIYTTDPYYNPNFSFDRGGFTLKNNNH